MNHLEKKNLTIKYLNEYNDKYFDYWNHLYAFSTENLTDLFNKNLFCNKDVLLTGSSADQLLIAQLYNTKSITHFDLNPYVKYFYDLKLSAIKELDLDEYLDFFYFDQNNFNENTFSLKTYLRIRNNLKEDSLDYWDTLFFNFDNYILRTRLFFIDDEEKNKNNYKKYLPYLQSNNYKELKNKTNLKDITFIKTNILDLPTKLTTNYDLIYFSNIFNRIEILDFYNYKTYIKNIYNFMNKIINHTNESGIILINYLYNSNKDEINDITNKYSHHIRYPIKVFNCEKNIKYIEIPSICKYHECQTDTIIGYKKKSLKKE